MQVGGTLCNLECTHCLVDSSPRNKSMQFLSRDTVRKHLENCEALGVKEIYFDFAKSERRAAISLLNDVLKATEVYKLKSTSTRSSAGLKGE